MKNSKTNIPEDIYVGFVRSMFRDPNILLIGCISHGLIGFLVFRASGEGIYLALAFLMLASGLYRYFGVKKVQSRGLVTDYDSALMWERYYLVGGAIQGFFTGLFCFVSLYLVPDVYGELAAVAVIMGSTVTIVGRNYGSRKMVAILAATGTIPIAAGLMLKGDLNYFVLGLYIIPFMFIITKMAGNVRAVLFTAITEEKKAKHLARRLDRALNTMGHGLIMLGSNGQVVVANAEAAKVVGFKTVDQMIGRTLRALLTRGVVAGLLSEKDSRYIETQLGNALGQICDRKLLMRLTDGRHFEFTAREGRDELGVLTFEEVTDRIEAEERIRHMARYDSLTALPNRAYFNELVSEHVATGDRDRLCGLVIFDLDDFKSVNDTLGHPVGDGLIVAVASKLATVTTDDVSIGRFGGDEFTIFFNDIADRTELVDTMDRLFVDLQGDVDVAGHAIRIQTSAGAVMARARDFDVDGMLVKADLALYNAKDMGKNTWKLFESAMDQAFRNRQVMKADLRAAIEGKALRAVYQPIIAMDTMRIESCEALCRWDHPEMGPISPAVFIPLAEEMGIVGQISTFVLETACAECVKWPDRIGVSVNLSAKDFNNGEIVAKIMRILERTGLCASRLEIEVTETALLDDRSSTRQYIEELKAKGISVALDDFGTGYSSLSYLHTLPLDKVKIDRSFLADITSNQRSLELLKGVVKLSRMLGLRVTIEGVETFDQLRMLDQSVKPDLLQGFLFGSPLSASGITTMANTIWPFAQELRVAQRGSAKG